MPWPCLAAPVLSLGMAVARQGARVAPSLCCSESWAGCEWALCVRSAVTEGRDKDINEMHFAAGLLRAFNEEWEKSFSLWTWTLSKVINRKEQNGNVGRVRFQGGWEETVEWTPHVGWVSALVRNSGAAGCDAVGGKSFFKAELHVTHPRWSSERKSDVIVHQK